MHTLIIGMTMSGKTTLAKTIAKQLKSSNHKVAVLDPLGDPDFDADFRTKDSAEFLEYAKTHQDHFLFVDESGVAMGRFNEPMNWLATTARHNGHLCTFISQGLTQLPPIVRGQCDRLFIFSCAKINTDLASQEWNEKKLAEIDKIPQYHFYLARRFHPLKFGKISLDKGTASVEYAECKEQTLQTGKT